MNCTYLNRVSPTYIENWAPALYALSIPQVSIPLSGELALALEARLWSREGRWCAGRVPSLEPLLQALNRAIRRFPRGGFVRLGSRSGKDSAYARTHGLRVETGDAAVRLLCEGSERVAFDLHLALRCGYTPHLFVREWLAIPRWAEFRCLMRKRSLVGISQYHHGTGHSPEIARNADTIEASIRAFFSSFAAVSHLDDAVVDVFVEGLETDSKVANVRLLELNPFFPKTDPGLFDWARPESFDGSFRFV